MRYLVDTNNVMNGAKEMALTSYRLRSLPDVDVTNKLSKISLEVNRTQLDWVNQQLVSPTSVLHPFYRESILT
jgi:hypothetical protein